MIPKEVVKQPGEKARQVGVLFRGKCQPKMRINLRVSGKGVL